MRPRFCHAAPNETTICGLRRESLSLLAGSLFFSPHFLFQQGRGSSRGSTESSPKPGGAGISPRQHLFALGSICGRAAESRGEPKRGSPRKHEPRDCRGRHKCDLIPLGAAPRLYRQEKLWGITVCAYKETFQVLTQ